MSAIRLFEEESLANLYAKFRPSYPQKVYDAISLFATKRGIDLKTGLALDLACGSGQGTFPLTNIVKKCIGVDVSKAQINCAKEKNVTEGSDAYCSEGKCSVELYFTAGGSGRWERRQRLRQFSDGC